MKISVSIYIRKDLRITGPLLWTGRQSQNNPNGKLIEIDSWIHNINSKRPALEINANFGVLDFKRD